MKKLIYLISIFIFSSLSFSKLTVGITLIPYYSYVTNIVGDKMNVLPIIPENMDVHSYRPTAQDIKKLAKVDVVVINGIGHDEFIIPMIEAVKKQGKNIKVINANQRTTTLISAGQKKAGVKNPHTFISITQAIQQIDYIAESLGELDPKNKMYYIKNARTYDKKLRELKRAELEKVKGKTKNVKIATTHAGYDYLLAEFGLTVSAVVEPAHAHNPSATDLKDIIDKVNENNIKILFDEEVADHKNANLIKNATDIKIAYLSHATRGKYTKDAFYNFMKQNLESVTKALNEVN